jgi:hypothetical protein
MVSYTESQWISVKYSECFLIALFFVYTIQHDHDGSLFAEEMFEETKRGN